MNEKIIELLNEMKSQMNLMQQDIAEIKSSITRIETQQHEDIIAVLGRIDTKVEVLKARQDEADNVIDVLAARTIRLEAKRNPH